jgi:hypothetical protein
MARGSNPTPSNSRPAYKGGGVVKGNSAQKKRAGTTQRPGVRAAGTPSSGVQTRGRAVTTSGGGGTGGRPGAEREAQDRANGTIHGQPSSGQRDQGTDVAPFSNSRAATGEGGYA